MASDVTTSTDIDDKLISLLETFKYPVYRQGSMAADAAYPDTFFTFWEQPEQTTDYDNETKFVIYDFLVYVYSNDPDILANTLKSARTLLKQNNFIILTRGSDAMSDEHTHTGKMFEVAYINTEN